MRTTWKLALLTLVVCVGAGTGVIVHRHRVQVKALKAYQATRQRAEHGDAVGEDRLGNRYYSGVGVPQSFGDALAWYRKAAAQGNADGMFAIGYMYDYAKGVPQDYVQAMKWYRAAADRGDALAEDAIGTMYYSAKGTAQDSTAALAWYRKAADAKYARGEVDLGSAYFYGRGVPRDYKEAARWYQLAAYQGYAPAEYDIGYMYRNGYGVPWSFWQARRWYGKAAAQGDANTLLLISEGFSPFQKAIILLRLAGGLLLLLGPFSYRQWAQVRGWSCWTAGMVCLLSAALGWYGFTHQRIWRIIYIPNAFTAFYFFLDVVLIVLCVQVIRLPRSDGLEELPRDVEADVSAHGQRSPLNW